MLDLQDAPLGEGWEQTERALTALQRDLSRTVPSAPMSKLLWRTFTDDDDDDDDDGAATEQLPGRRWAFVGKGLDWFYGADGGFELSR